MLAPIPFNIDVLRGREALHLVNHNGGFALSAELKPKLTKGKLNVAMPSPNESNMLVCALLGILTGRKVMFIFCDRKDDPRFCECDFVLTQQSPLFGSDKADAIEVFLAILWNTPWVIEIFDDPAAADGWLQQIWTSCFEGLSYVWRIAGMSQWDEKETAWKALWWLDKQLRAMQHTYLLEGNLMKKLRSMVHDHKGVIKLPPGSEGMGVTRCIQFIRAVEAETTNAREHIPVITIVGQVKGKWHIWPALTLDDQGNEIPCMNFKAALSTEPDSRKQMSQLYSKLHYNKHTRTEVIECADVHAACMLADWLCACFHGKAKQGDLEGIVGLYDGIPK